MKRTLFMVLLTTLILATIAAAQPMNPGRMAEKLGLTEQQIEQMHGLMAKHQTDMIMRRAELKIARLELREIMMNPKLNENAALSKLDQISKMKSDIARLNLQHKIAMRKMLNDEQFKKWQDMRGDMRPQFGRRHGRGGRGEGMPCPMPPMMGQGRGFDKDNMEKDGGEKGE